MKKSIIAAAVFFCAAISVSAEVVFDLGRDIKTTVSELKAGKAGLPEAKFAQLVDSTRDCKKVSFTSSEQLVSETVRLKSVSTYRDCQNMYPIGQQCWDRYDTKSADVHVQITEPRVLAAGQKESFEMCMMGAYLYMNKVVSPYKYSVNLFLNVFQATPDKSADTVSFSFADKGNEKVCGLVSDSAGSCIYRCPDGSYISRPSPFGPNPNPWGPFPVPSLPGCMPTVPFVSW